MFRRPLPVWLLTALVVAGCGGGNLSVPEKNQREAEENYGRQQMMMSGLNETSSEQAGARHQDATTPVERPGSERKPPGQ